MDNAQRCFEQELNKKWWTKGDAIKLETYGNQKEIVQDPDASLKRRKIGEPDINPCGAPKRGESEQGFSAENEFTGGVYCGGQQALV